MARIRTLKPEFFSHKGLSSCSVESRLLAIALLQMADREGRMKWIPMQVHAHAFPYEYSMDIDALARELEAVDYLVRYSINGDDLAEVVNFNAHQVLPVSERASVLPGLNGGLTGYRTPPSPAERQGIYERDGFKCGYCGIDMSKDSRKRCLDHIIPYSKGGTNDHENLVTSCKHCNAVKAARSPDEAGMPLLNGVQTPPVNPPVNPPVSHASTKIIAGKGKGKGNGTGSIPSTTGASPPIDPKKALWDSGVKLLGNGGRSILGKAIKMHGDEKTAQAIAVTMAAGPVDPKTYFLKSLPSDGHVITEPYEL